MDVCILATAVKHHRQTIRYSRARKENDLELFSRGKNEVLKEQRANMFQIDLQLADENFVVNSLGVRIIEPHCSGRPQIGTRQLNDPWCHPSQC